MDYKEKYEMALEGIQEILGSGEDSIKMSRLQLRLQGIFPELKENEDEKWIPKEIAKYLIEKGGFRSCWLAWLEKQSKNNIGISEATKQKLEDNLNKALEKETPESWNKFLDEQAEQKPMNEKSLYKAGYLDGFEDGVRDAIIKEDEQKVAWSEEDDKILKSIIINIENLQFSEDMREKYHHIPNANKSYYQIKIDWLKFIKERIVPQQKQEWSEEDKEVINLLLELVYEQDKMSPQIPSNEKRKRMLYWLKSLKERYTWKPSEEQMQALNAINVTGDISYTGQGQELISLYNDLKKLKGE